MTQRIDVEFSGGTEQYQGKSFILRDTVTGEQIRTKIGMRNLLEIDPKIENVHGNVYAIMENIYLPKDREASHSRSQIIQREHVLKNLYIECPHIGLYHKMELYSTRCYW